MDAPLCVCLTLRKISGIYSGPCCLANTGCTSRSDLHSAFCKVLTRNRVYIPNHTEKYSDFYQLSSLVRLGHKYQIEDVQNQALAALQRYFVPLTFEDLDRPDFHNSLYRDACGIELVHLARLTDNPTMLPIAFYACVSFGSDVVDGWRREDGTIQHLGPGDLKRCFEAYAEIALRKAPMTKRIFDVGPSLNCQSPELCATELQDTYPVIFPAIRLINGWSDVIHDYYGSCICRACAKMLEERGVAERRAFWKDLATIFRL